MARVKGEKGGGISGSQKFVICIGRGLVRADDRESFCMMLAVSVGRSGEMAVQGMAKTEVKSCEARRSSSPSSEGRRMEELAGSLSSGIKISGGHYYNKKVTVP